MYACQSRKPEKLSLLCKGKPQKRYPSPSQTTRDVPAHKTDIDTCADVNPTDVKLRDSQLGVHLLFIPLSNGAGSLSFFGPGLQG